MRLSSLCLSLKSACLATLVVSGAIILGGVSDAVLAQEGLAQEGLVQENANANGDAATCDWLVVPARTNTEEQGEVIVIGALSERPYLVVIPNGNTDVLATVRRCVPDAFVTQSRLGSYIQAGAFQSRGEANDFTRAMNRAGFDTRVIHRRGITSFH